jgi:hypothetical protein
MTPVRAARLLRALAHDLEATVAAEAELDPVILAGHLAMVSTLLADLFDAYAGEAP